MQEFPPFRLDPVNQCLWRRRGTADDERILLPPKAFAVLHYLVAHAGRLVTPEELLEAVWPETYVQPEVLRNHIFDIPRALGDSPQAPRFVETLPSTMHRRGASTQGLTTAHASSTYVGTRAACRHRGGCARPRATPGPRSHGLPVCGRGGHHD
jgi:hypothetical protein